MIKNYPEAVQYLYDNLPMFQRVGSAAYRPDLRNTIRLCEVLDNPQNKFKTIHIAGTNGKGSTSHLLASVLQSSGYKTGLYTSPHLKNFTERIRINGQEVLQEFVVSFVNRIQPVIEELKPSFFEITVAMAFDYFAREKVDVAVIEVGLGGRLDSTNVITPIISVITNIGWDHKQILGNTLEEIAHEKAGIIKDGVPVVISERQPEVEKVFIDKSRAHNAPLSFASDVYQAKQFNKPGKFYYDILKEGGMYMPQVQVPLEGIYQQRNLPGIFLATDILRVQGYQITPDTLRHGLEHVIEQTNFKGRWQKLSDAPLMICDTAHNIDGVRVVIEQIKLQRVRNIHMVWGMVKDKDIADILRILPREATYYFCQAKIPRALDADALCAQAKSFGLKGEVITDVNDAIRQALVNASENDLIFIGGSTFVVAEIDGL